MTTVDPTVGVRLRQLRQARGLSQAALGALAGGIAPQAISSVERGVCPMFPAWRNRIAAAIGIDPDAL